MKPAEFNKKCSDFIKNEGLIKQGERVIVALSGGADSVCLCLMLNELSARMDLELIAVHVHHGIRGDEADRDEMFARSVAASLGIAYLCERCEAPAYANSHHLTLEEAARTLRYEALYRVANEKKADKIAIAHHLDDQAETVLMNLLRGSGPDGLSGMRPIRGKLIRPLLCVSKDDIYEYLDALGQGYMVDSTNESKEHTRNRVRLELLPLARELYPQADRHIVALAEDMNQWKKEVDSSVEKCKNSVIDGNKIIISEYLKENHTTRHAILREVIERVIPGTKDVSRVHYLRADALAVGDERGEKTVMLPQGVVIRRQYGCLVVDRLNVTDNYADGANATSCANVTEGANATDDSKKIYINLQIDGSTMVTCEDKNIEFSTEIVTDFDTANIFLEKDYTKYINYDRIENSLVVRNPSEGDYFEMDENGTKKKLSRYYIDKKLPRSKRENALVVADGSHIVWALPDRLSYAYRVSDDTKQILKISMK